MTKDPLPSISTRVGAICVLKGRLKPDLGYFSVRPNSGADLSNAFKTGPTRPARNAVANTFGSCCPAVYKATTAAAAARR